LKIGPLTPADAANLKRDKPMGDFERMADISVDHPTVVATYPAAQGIAARNNGKRRNLRRPLAKAPTDTDRQ
jgi:hypothetical protein